MAETTTRRAVRRYRVIVDAVSIPVGETVNDHGVKKEIIKRFLNGAELVNEGKDVHPTIARLLELGAIVPAPKYVEGTRRTPRGVLKHLNPEVDPGAPPVRKATRHEIDHGGPLS